MARYRPVAGRVPFAGIGMGVALTLGLAACSGEVPDVDVDDWSAITDASWPEASGDATGELPLDVNRQRGNIVVVLDMSGSMTESQCAGDHEWKADAAQVALETWIEGVPAEVNVGLIAFNSDGVNTLVPLGTGNRERFIEAAREVRPGGGTPLLSAMSAAHELLQERGRVQLGYGRYQIVTITDGAHSPGENPLSLVERILVNPANPVEMHTIGFCIEDSVLRQPGFVHYRSANDPDQLARGLSSVLAESATFEPAEDFNE